METCSISRNLRSLMKAVASDTVRQGFTGKVGYETLVPRNFQLALNGRGCLKYAMYD